MRLLSFFLPLILALPLAAAHAEVFVSGAAKLLIYEEDGVTHTARLVTAEDGWPELTDRRRFISPAEGRDYLDQNYPMRRPLVKDGGRALKAMNVPLWTVTESWSWAWEQKLADWIRADVDKDFFVRHGIATDCADVAYALRWIFAREHGLPMSSRLASGDWLNQDSMRPKWLNLKTAKEWHKDERFRAALDYLLDFTYTHTLRDDSYPTEIKIGALMEGGFFLTIHERSGHTRPFTRVVRAGERGLPIYILQSTTPRQIQPLRASGFWIPDLPVKGEAGLLRFRWPDGTGRGLIPAAQMPGYSEEQFDPGFVKAGEMFFVAVFRHLDPSFTLEEISRELLQSLKDALVFRKQIVDDGYAFCAANDCRPGTPGYEGWSTPSRDAQIGELFLQLDNVRYMLPEAEQRVIAAEFVAPFLDLDGTLYTLQLARWAWRNQIYGTDPRIAPEERWSLSPQGFDHRLRNWSRELWTAREAFLQKTSSCPPALCTPGTTAWEERSSRKQDLVLSALMTATAQYCGNAELAACNEMQRRLAQPFNLRDPNWTLSQTLLSFLHLNADPRHSAAARAQGTGPKPLYSGLGSRVLSSREFVAMGTEDRLRLWDVRAERIEVASPAGHHWVAFSPDLNRAWFRRGLNFGSRDLLSGSETQAQLPFEPFGYHPLDSGSIFMWNQDQWAFVSADGNQVHSGSYRELRPLDGEHALVKVKSGYGLFKFSATSVMSYPELPSILHSVKAFRHGWMIFDGQLHLLRKSDGQWMSFPKLTSVLAAETLGEAMYGLSGGQLLRLELNAGGAVTREDKIGNFQTAYADGVGVGYLVNGLLTFFFEQQGRFEAYPLFAGETEIRSVRGDFAVVRVGEKMIVRRRNNPSALKVFEHETVQLVEGSSRPGLVKMCALRMPQLADYNSACRLEDVEKPGEFSLYTGVSAFEFEMIYGVDEGGPRGAQRRRGIKAGIGSNTVWLDL